VSLLLDALKKAANDKQKALQLEQAGSGETNQSTSISDQQNVQATASDEVAYETTLATKELSLQGIDDALEDDESIIPDEENSDNHVEKSHLNDDINDGQSVATEALTLERRETKNNSDVQPLTLSDEALTMLIYKTNRSVKRGRRLFVFAVLTFSLLILASGGTFYYMGLQEEISVLERKHRIAMQSMRLKTSDENIPAKSEIIRNLVSETSFNEKVQHTKQQLSGQLPSEPKIDSKNASQAATIVPQKVNTKATNTASANTASTKAQAVKNTVATLSIQKTKKTDPVGEKLEAAWLAYESARYDEAATLYKSVLSFEENNRDALLGLGAIAVIEKDVAVAKNIYLKLLEMDPRDPIAIAALASLHDRQFTLADKDYLLSALKKSPNVHHLNFALGNIYAQQNNWKSAQRYYFNAWQHNNESADYVFNLAVSMDQLGKQRQALKFYEDSLLKSKNKQPGSSRLSFSRQAVKKRISELSESRSIEAAGESN